MREGAHEAGSPALERLAELLSEAEKARAEHEKRLGGHEEGCRSRYAAFVLGRSRA